jgi:hypothetical protein
MVGCWIGIFFNAFPTTAAAGSINFVWKAPLTGSRFNRLNAKVAACFSMKSSA